MKFVMTMAVTVAMIVGEILCLVKFINSDFKPTYKREMIYGLSFITGAGFVVGYFNIPDSK